MSVYAANTSVDEGKSRSEIERTLRRYGATEFMYATKTGKAVIAFRAHDRLIRFTLPLPDENDSEFKYTPKRRTKRSDKERLTAWEQACRQKWRALALLIKAQLEAVESGIVTFEDVFLAHTLLPNGQTVGQWTDPQITTAYERNEVPAILPVLGDGRA